MSKDVLIDSRIVPSSFGPLRDANANARIQGECGDTMEFWIDMENDYVKKACFTTDGCGHSMLCGSAVANLIEGKKLEQIAILTPDLVIKRIENFPEESQHCATLALKTARAALNSFTQTALQNNKEKQAVPDENTPNLKGIDKKIVVLSGKGGVGKSTIAVNMAAALAQQGRRVGLLDIDIHGPSIPTMLGLEGVPALQSEYGLQPIELGQLKILSIGFLLKNLDDAVIWRGPMKSNLIKQFLHEAVWGELDYLIVDCPPGTGDEPLSVCQYLENPDGAIIVTTPQQVATTDVSKSVTFCRKIDLPILGIVENMSGFVCPDCGKKIDIFKRGGGERIAKKYQIPLLGRVPIDANVGVAGDDGTPFIRRFKESSAAEVFMEVVEKIQKS